MIKAVIFDMDGLILDTEKLLVKYWCQAANEAGFPMQREHALNIRSLARKFAIPYLQGLFGENFDYVKIRSRRMELMKEHLDKHGLETKPGITTLLDYLDKKGIPAAIATATDIQRTEDYLGKVGLLGRFSRIVCALWWKVANRSRISTFTRHSSWGSPRMNAWRWRTPRTA